MKAITILLFLTISLLYSVSESENYILQQWTVGSISDSQSTSENYSLQSSSISINEGNNSDSEHYSFIPGYYQGEIFGELLPPENVQISVSGDNVLISWNAVNGATTYKIYYSDNPADNFAEDTTGTLNGTSWTAPFSFTKKFYYVKAIR